MTVPLWLGLAVARAHAPATLEIVLERPAVVVVDGQIVPYTPAGPTTRLTVRGLAPGLHEVAFHDCTGNLLREEDVRLPRGGRARVRLARRVEVETRPELSVTVDGQALTVAVDAGGSIQVSIDAGAATHQEEDAREAQETRQKQRRDVPANRLVTFRSLDGEWANVYLDGKLVWELRAGESEITLPVATGEHHLFVRDFMDDETWSEGTLVVSGEADLVIGIAENRPVQVFNDRNAFRGR